jgi:CheY-like chemotaxis protein
MNCPRCKTPIGPLASPDAIVTCPGCGSRLMTRAAALRSQGSGPSQPTVPAAPASPSLLDAATQGMTAPPPRASVKVGVRQTTVSGKTAGAAVKSGGGSRKAEASRAPAVTLEMVLNEIQAVRDTQQLILEAVGGLRRGQAAPAGGGAGHEGTDDAEGTTLSPIRATDRKSVVLIDDDPQTRDAAVSELERADVPVRAFTDANQALSAIAEDKPDVIILELGVNGELAGKDLVNMIKATMEWVDIPIVLWTREPVSNQKEARQIHGADEVVSKSAGAAALVARVITVFRR